MKTLILAFVFHVVLPAMQEPAKPAVEIRAKNATVARVRCAYNRRHMITSRSAKAFRFFAFARKGAGCLIA